MIQDKLDTLIAENHSLKSMILDLCAALDYWAHYTDIQPSLESWYVPPWPTDVVEKLIKEAREMV